MKILGYVLIVLNILAGGAFVYLATVDWSERQKWTYANFRHELAIAGLPVEQAPPGEFADDPDKIPFHFEYENPGEKEWITPAVLNDIFTANGGETLGGPPVTSQEEEVQRLRDLVAGRLRDADGIEQKLNLLVPALLRMARTNAERDEVWALTQNPNAENVGRAEQALMGHFDAALAESAPAGGAISEEMKRERIARVLFNIGDGYLAAYAPQAGQAGPPISQEQRDWQSRVITVVGLDEYVDVVAERATALGDMAGRLRVRLDREKAEFLPLYRSLVERSRALSNRLDALEQQIAKDEAERDDNLKLRDARQAEVNDLETALGIARATAAESLANQGDKERQLFETEMQLGAALEAIGNLESELRRIELGDR